jgi:hypothetical protein
MKVKLVTFSDGSHGLRAAGKRLVKQADATGWFHYPSEHWTLKTLRTKMPEFVMEHQNFMKVHPKGLGLWIWKPAILSYLVSQLEEGEAVLLLDAGCQLNSTKESNLRFNDYLDLCMANDMLLMQLNENSFGFNDLTDAAWTKRSVLDALDPLSTSRLTNQIQSGIIFATKSARSEKVSKMWLDYCVNSNYSFLLNSSGGEPQSKEFMQHRWEQSIISLIVKSEGIVPLADETYFYPNWSNGLKFPIWAMRNRSGGDAYRRNFIDLFMLFLAKIERKLISAFNTWR